MNWMKSNIKSSICFAVFSLLIAAVEVKLAHAEPVASREYQIKAAFLYNFIKFVDWPKEKVPDPNTPIVVGIIGKDLFEDAFKPLQEKEKDVLIQRFRGFAELEKSSEKKKDEPHPQQDAISKCHLLFVCPSESEHFADIVMSVKDRNVLTIADTQGFLATGGIINFVTEEKKVRFDINAVAAKQAKITIRSQLLRLARQVIKEENG